MQVALVFVGLRLGFWGISFMTSLTETFDFGGSVPNLSVGFIGSTLCAMGTIVAMANYGLIWMRFQADAAAWRSVACRIAIAPVFFVFWPAWIFGLTSPVFLIALFYRQAQSLF